MEDAQIFDLPDRLTEIYLAISGPASARLAAEKADGIVATEPKPDLGQAHAVKIAHERGRFGIAGWKVMSELPQHRQLRGRPRHGPP